MELYGRLPQHIGIIPDGNRRWAVKKGLKKEDGYDYGLEPAFELYKTCVELGIKEITFYGFTLDNTKRPAAQTKAFQKACVDSVLKLTEYDANLLIVGKTDSPLFPKELLPYTKRTKIGKGLIKVNFLVNYGWDWDLCTSSNNNENKNKESYIKRIASADISRIDLIIRWGGHRRLSGFLPIQTVYADFYVIEDFWPDYNSNHLYEALDWFQSQDITLGG